MANVVFLEPRSSSVNIYSGFGIPRLGSVLLSTIVNRAGHSARVYAEDMAGIDFSAVVNADVVAISTLTPTAPRAYEIARHVRARGIPCLIGGPHVTFLADEALEASDYVFRGEGESAIVPFVEAVVGGGDLESIPGLSFRHGNAVVHNPLPATPVDIRRNPIPDLELVNGFRERRGVTRWRIVPMQTSRGCPFPCTFCTVARMFGRRMRYRDLDSVMEELSRYDPRHDFIFFYDDNFTADLKRTGAILREMIDRRMNLNWSAQIRLDVARDEEFLDLMRDSGCRHVYIGFESISDETLSLIRKSQTKLGMVRSTKAIHDRGIGIHGMFVFGFDSDTKKALAQTRRFAMRQKLRTVQFMVLTPLPGTETFDALRAANRLVTEDWSFYDGQHAVHAPHHMSVLELQNELMRAYRAYCSVFERLRSLSRFDWYRFVVQTYARRTLRRWARENRFYMKALKMMRRESGVEVLRRLRKTSAVDDIGDRINAAAAATG